MAKAGHFDKVITSINDMIQDLKDEEAADIEKYDQCKEELFKINKTISQVTWLIKNNNVRINKLDAAIDKKREEVKETEQLIAETSQQMLDLTAERKASNAKFLEEKKDDQDAIKLLTSARDVLAKYYKKNDVKMGKLQDDVKAASLAQRKPVFKVSEDQAPEADFSDKGKGKYEAKGILQILQYIIENLNDEIKNDMAAEEQDQLKYEELMAAAKKFRGEMILKKVDLNSAIADDRKMKGKEEVKRGKNEAALKD